MASLSREQVIARILKPKNRVQIDKAVHQEQRLLMHCESILEKNNLPPLAYRGFTEWWKSLITKEKHETIDKLIGTPLSTLSVTKDIFDQLGKFIDAQDRYVAFKFTDVDYTNDYEKYLEAVNDDEFWRQKSVEALKTDICSIVVVDLPSVQKTMRPEPYKYFVSPNTFVDLEINAINGNVEYFIFKQSDINWDASLYPQAAVLDKFNLIGTGTKMERVIALDDDYYRVLVKEKKTGEWLVLSESAHGLGYCPAIDFWSPSIKGTNRINKNGPITNVLKKLDYLLFYQTLADYMGLYGPFPVLVTYDSEEEFIDDKVVSNAQAGTYPDATQNSSISASRPTTPEKVASGFIGPGSVRTVPIPVDASDHNFMESPMKFVGMEVPSLEYVDKKIELLRNEIVEICTGEDKDYNNEIAKNPEMLAATFERKETIYGWIKRQVERVHRFTTETQAILRYGKDFYLGCTVDYGSDYNLKGANLLTSEFESSVKAGMPTGYSNEIALAASNTRFKNNPEVLARMRILSDLEPYPGISWELIQSLGINNSDKINFIIKINFISFVSRFELENGSIVEFGSALSYSEKISIIKKQFIEYAKSIEWTESRPAPERTNDAGKQQQRP